MRDGELVGRPGGVARMKMVGRVVGIGDPARRIPIPRGRPRCGRAASRNPWQRLDCPHGRRVRCGGDLPSTGCSAHFDGGVRVAVPLGVPVGPALSVVVGSDAAQIARKVFSPAAEVAFARRVRPVIPDGAAFHVVREDAGRRDVEVVPGDGRVAEMLAERDGVAEIYATRRVSPSPERRSDDATARNGREAVRQEIRPGSTARCGSWAATGLPATGSARSRSSPTGLRRACCRRRLVSPTRTARGGRSPTARSSRVREESRPGGRADPVSRLGTDIIGPTIAVLGTEEQRSGPPADPRRRGGAAPGLLRADAGSDLALLCTARAQVETAATRTARRSGPRSASTRTFCSCRPYRPGRSAAQGDQRVAVDMLHRRTVRPIEQMTGGSGLREVSSRAFRPPADRPGRRARAAAGRFAMTALGFERSINFMVRQVRLSKQVERR